MEISIDNRIISVCPDMQIGVIRAKVVNSPTSDKLWNLIGEECERIANIYPIAEIKNRPAIAKTRQLYKALGKEPNRYRVSSEALCRRIVRGLGIYRIDTLVDLINLASIKSGYAIGGFDADKIVGNKLHLTAGTADDHFEGIGRGTLNIEGLPVYRDEVGGIGTPTSDEERTKITIDTTHIHININAFATEMPLSEMIPWVESLLVEFAQASSITSFVISPNIYEMQNR